MIDQVRFFIATPFFFREKPWFDDQLSLGSVALYRDRSRTEMDFRLQPD